MTAEIESDASLQATCGEIVALVTEAVNAESPQKWISLRLPNGPIVGNQILIDATEKKEVVNLCRLSSLNPDLAPEGEVARMEYEHDKQTKYGMQRVYSIQSVRRHGSQLVLLENFMAATSRDVREEDFRPIQSDQYAQQTVLATLKEWTHYRAWQIQEANK
jgi:hypothetical protein